MKQPTHSLCPNPSCLQQHPLAEEKTSCDACDNPLVLNRQYRLLNTIGEGGMGKTFLAQDARFIDTPNEYCVIKQLKEASATEGQTQQARELLKREASRLLHLRHPGIPAYRDFFDAEIGGESRFYMVQQHIDGTSLQDWLESSGQMSLKTLLPMMTKVLEILDYLHNQKDPETDEPAPILHLDIKPANLMLRHKDNAIFLIDFGIATQLPEADIATLGGKASIHGFTPGFAPFEQTMGYAAPASDLYAWAMTCLVMLINKDPRELINPLEQTAHWVSYATLTPRLTSLFRQCLSLQVSDRIASAAEVLAYLDETTTSAPKPLPTSDRSGPNELNSPAPIAETAGYAPKINKTAEYHTDPPKPQPAQAQSQPPTASLSQASFYVLLTLVAVAALYVFVGKRKTTPRADTQKKKHTQYKPDNAPPKRVGVNVSNNENQRARPTKPRHTPQPAKRVVPHTKKVRPLPLKKPSSAPVMTGLAATMNPPRARLSPTRHPASRPAKTQPLVSPQARRKTTAANVLPTSRAAGKRQGAPPQKRWSLAHENLVQFTLKNLSHPDWRRRRAVLAGLMRTNRKHPIKTQRLVIDLLRRGDDQTRWRLLREIKRFYPTPSKELLSVLKELLQGEEPGRRFTYSKQSIVYLLSYYAQKGNKGPIEILLSACEDTNTWVRHYAYKTISNNRLYRHCDKKQRQEYARISAKLLHDKEHMVRRTAAMAYQRRIAPDTSTIHTIARLAFHDQIKQVRWIAIATLRMHCKRQKVACAHLLEGLGSSDLSTRRYTARVAMGLARKFVAFGLGKRLYKAAYPLMAQSDIATVTHTIKLLAKLGELASPSRPKILEVQKTYQQRFPNARHHQKRYLRHALKKALKTLKRK